MEEDALKKQLSKKRRTTKKRRFCGNQHNIKHKQQDDDDGETALQQQQDSSDGDEAGTSTPVVTSTSASASKIDLSFYEEHNKSSDNQNKKTVDGKTSSQVDITCIYIFADINIITELFNLVGRCPECNSKISFVVGFNKKKGQAQKF